MRSHPRALHWVVWFLCALLPVQATAGLASALQGQRHVHRVAVLQAGTGGGTVAPGSPQEHLLRLATTLAAAPDASEDGAHDARPHRHDAAEPGLVPLGDGGDDSASAQSGAAPQAPPPAGQTVPQAPGATDFERPAAALLRSRTTAPPLRPPRGR